MLLGSAYGKIEIDASGVKRGVAQAKSSLSELMGVGNKLIGVFTALASAITIKKVVDFAEASLTTAARVEELATINEVLAKNAGLSTEAVKNEAQAVRDMGIEAAASQQVVAEFVRNNLDLVKAHELARVAQDAATISGTNSTEATLGLIRAIVTLQPEVARTYGITVDFNAAYQKMANAIGVSTNQLTSQQKQQAALNAMIEAGVQVAGAYDAAMTKGSKIVRSFPRYINDIMVNLGTPFLASFDKAVKAIAEFLKALGKATAEGGDLYPMLQRLAESASVMVEHFVDFIKDVDFVKLAQDIEPVLQGLIKLMTFVIDHGDLIIAMLINIGKLLVLAFSVKKIIDVVSFFQSVYTVFYEIGLALPMIGQAFTAISTVITGTVIPAVTSFVIAAAPVIIAILLIVGAIALLYWAFKTNFGGIRTTAEQLWFILKWGFKKMWEEMNAAAKVGLGKLRDEFERETETLKTTAQQLWYILKTGNAKAFFKVYEDGSGALHDLAVAFGLPEEASQDFLARMWLIRERIQELGAAIRSDGYEFTLLFEDGSGALLNLATAFGLPKEAAQDFLGRIWLIRERFRELGEAIRNDSYRFTLLFEDGSGALLNLATAFGIPEKAAQEFLASIWQVVEKFKEAIDQIQERFMGYVEWLRSAWQNVLNYFSQIRDRILGLFRIDWSSIGRSIINGIITGLLGGNATLAAAVTNVAKTILDTFKRELDAHSPSRKAAYFGRMTSEGYLQGMAAGMDSRRIAALLQRPVQQVHSSSQTNIIQMASGLTIREARRIVAENNEDLLRVFETALGAT